MINNGVPVRASTHQPLPSSVVEERAADPYAALLLAQTSLNDRDLRKAVDRALRDGVHLADALSLEGLLSEPEAYNLLGRATSMTFIDLSGLLPSALSLKLVPERFARRHLLLPLAEDNRTLTYATARPFNHEAERDVAFASGRRPVALLAPRSRILAALDAAYPKETGIDQLLARVQRDAPGVQTVAARVVTAAGASPIVELCDEILAAAVAADASDIHIEPASGGSIVRHRVCGILEHVATLPPEGVSGVTNRFKVIARADIAVKQRPQDGAFRATVHGRTIDVRLSTLPTVHGEKIVLRIIDRQSSLQSLDALGYDAANLDRLRRALDRPDGLVLVTGPTGSGKTTVLYAALQHLRNGHTNIVTVEDPVERHVEGVNQIPVNSRGGNSFAQALRSVLRQDPNVIMVGEIRDGEVAQIVGQAAYTGHLVLSSLHTTDAPAAITRLINLELEPFKVAESLSVIVAQRLVRTICPACRIATRSGVSVGKGCELCRFSGYAGRVAVPEVLAPDAELRSAIRAGAGADELRAAMRRAGCQSMRESAEELCRRGVSSTEEIVRVFGAEESECREPSREQRQRVLVADDDRMIRMLVRMLLEREGFDVIEAENGSVAVAVARRERPDLLLVDLMMPEVDGFGVIDQIRRDLALARLPIMVLTSETGTAVESRVLELGADDYLVKPIEPDVLLPRVRAMFRRMERAA